MTEPLHPGASQHLPSFITAPGETDVLMVVMAVILALAILMFGILFFRLHTMPERIAHKSQKVQFEIVAVLGLIALFTHMHIFWVAALLLALVDLPDFGTSLSRIAGSVEKMASKKGSESPAEPPYDTMPLANRHTGRLRRRFTRPLRSSRAKSRLQRRRNLSPFQQAERS
jgi:multisubunit Na+/H+ antiporter MnhF subunit